MPNVLIRDVPPDDLGEIRAAAAEQGVSLQTYLREAVHTQAVHLRRRAALSRIGQRLLDRPPITAEQRQAMFDAVDNAHDQRADELTDRP